METLPSFDVYFLDGSILRFVCNIEAENHAAAEMLLQKRVRAELRWNMVAPRRRMIRCLWGGDYQNRKSPNQAASDTFPARPLFEINHRNDRLCTGAVNPLRIMHRGNIAN